MFQNFIPEVWVADLMAQLQTEHVFANLFNHDYEGEIKNFGDSVHIGQIGAVIIKNYTGADIDGPEDVTGTDRTMKIEKGSYFNIRVKDIDRAQSHYNLMAAAMDDATYRTADKVDIYLANKCAAAASVGVDIIKPDPDDPEGIITEKVKVAEHGTTASPITITPQNAWTAMVDLGAKMDDLKIPRKDRWVVVPPSYLTMLAKDTRYSGYGTDLAGRVLANGIVDGDVAGFRMAVSANVAKDDDVFHVAAATPKAATYAEQIVELEPYRQEKNFADAIKGLHVCGGEIVRPDLMTVMHLKFGTAS